jgi:hypothetical protein
MFSIPAVFKPHFRIVNSETILVPDADFDPLIAQEVDLDRVPSAGGIPRT